MSRPPHIRFSALTHVGKVRKVNEDSILSMPEQGIWIVSDGMGGHEAGDFASQAVIDAATMMEPDLEPLEKIRALRAAIMRAHDVITTEAAERGGATIGATVVTLTLADGHFAAFWAGDSRLYLLRAGELEMLTTDHSIVSELVLSGQMSWDEAELHPQSNAIVRAVGVGQELELDKVRGELLTGDRFLLCSDGLSKYATFKDLRLAMQGAAIETVADKLLQIALSGGGADNISVIVVDVV